MSLFEATYARRLHSLRLEELSAAARDKVVFLPPRLSQPEIVERRETVAAMRARGLTRKEIADALGITVSMVKNDIYYLKKRPKTALSEVNG